MVFIQRSKGHAKASCQDRQPQPPDPVYIEGEGDRDGQQKIFGHMGELSHGMMNPFYVIVDLVVGPFKFKGLIGGFHDDLADFVAQVAGSGTVLGGKRKNQIHHHQRRNEGERL